MTCSSMLVWIFLVLKKDTATLCGLRKMNQHLLKVKVGVIGISNDA